MRTGVRTAGCAAALAAVLGVGWAAGATARPAFPGAPGIGAPAGPGPAQPAPVADRTSPATPSTADGYTLVPRTSELAAGAPGEYAFTVTGPSTATPALGGAPRVVVVGEDAVDYTSLTPRLDPDGVWRGPLTLERPGRHRVFVALAPAGRPPLTLAADLLAPGPVRPVPVAPSRVAEVDGYQVRLDGDLVVGGPAQVFVTVSRGGAPVTDLEPLDDGFGRIVGFRAADLALVDVHPDAAPPAPTDRAGPGLAFTAEVPAAGTYRLFLDFRHGGAVRTAVFTVPTG